MEFLNHRCSQKTRQKTAVTHRQRVFCRLVAELGLMAQGLLLRKHDYSMRETPEWGA